MDPSVIHLKNYLKMNLLKKLKSNEFALTVAILSVLVQSFHTYSVFYSVSSLHGTMGGIIQAVLFAVVFDLAILFYTVRNRKDVVLGASFAMFLFNAYYYYIQVELSTLQLIFGAFVSVVIPMTQYYYAEEIQEDDEPDGMNAELMIAEDNAATWKKKHDAMFAELQDTSKKYNELESMRGNWSAYKKERDEHITVLSEELGKLTAANHQLKVLAGELPTGAKINPAEELAEIQDRTILGIEKARPGKIISTTDPI